MSGCMDNKNLNLINRVKAFPEESKSVIEGETRDAQHYLNQCLYCWTSHMYANVQPYVRAHARAHTHTKEVKNLTRGKLVLRLKTMCIYTNTYSKIH